MAEIRRGDGRPQLLPSPPPLPRGQTPSPHVRRANPQVDRIVLCDMYGSRMPEVRAMVRHKIADVYDGLDTSLECFPEDHVEAEPTAYLRVGPWGRI